MEGSWDKAGGGIDAKMLGDKDPPETQVVWRESLSGEDAGEVSEADGGGVSEAGVLGEAVGLDESSDVEEEASSVGRRKATKGMGRLEVVFES